MTTQPQQRWDSLSEECHECGSSFVGTSLTDLDRCAACGEIICRECQCDHEGLCWGRAKTEKRSCCGDGHAGTCSCPCHEEAPS